MCWRIATNIACRSFPRGGGTSLAGQVINRAVVIDCSPHCRSIVSVDPPARRAVVEPGVVLDQLNAELAPHGLMFGPDVATSTHATLGGMIGNNSAGARSILFGRTVDNIAALDVAMADGSVVTLDEGAAERDPRIRALTDQVLGVVRRLEREIDARFPRTRRRVNGYNLDMLLQQMRASTPGSYDRVNLAHMIVGSEGTLGAVMNATLDLVAAPQRRGLAVLSFNGVKRRAGGGGGHPGDGSGGRRTCR